MDESPFRSPVSESTAEVALSLEAKIAEIEDVVNSKRTVDMLFFAWIVLLFLRMMFLHRVEDYLAAAARQGELPALLPYLLTFAVWGIYAIWYLYAIVSSVRLALLLYGKWAAVIAGGLALFPLISVMVIFTLSGVANKYLKLEGIAKEALLKQGDELRASIRNSLVAQTT